MKWVPAVLWFVLQPRARGWGLVFLAVFALLSLALLPLTIIQLQVLFGFGQRPVRADYLVYIWSAVPWWWRHRDPFAFLRPRRGGRRRPSSSPARDAGGGRGARIPGRRRACAWTRPRVAIRRFVGLEERRRRDRFAIAAAAAEAADPPPVPVEPAEPLSPPA